MKKECGLIPKEENLTGYANTKNDRIRKIFGRRMSGYSEEELTALKKNTPKFAEAIYGVDSGMGLGNDVPGDGWKYRGRGYIQLTGKSLYKKFGEYSKIDIMVDPDLLLTDRFKSAIVAVGYLKYLIKMENFTDQGMADRAVTQAIGGRGLNLDKGYGSEIIAIVNNYSKDFGDIS